MWLGTKVLKDQATQSFPIPEKDYCNICTPDGRIYLHIWQKFTTHLDIGESDKEPEEDKDSGWDVNI